MLLCPGVDVQRGQQLHTHTHTNRITTECGQTDVCLWLTYPHLKITRFP